MNLKNFKINALIMAALAFLMLAPAGLIARDRDNDPPGPAGGKGTNWENPPGPKGGPGASPDHKKPQARKHHLFCKKHPNHPSCTKEDAVGSSEDSD